MRAGGGDGGTGRQRDRENEEDGREFEYMFYRVVTLKIENVDA